MKRIGGVVPTAAAAFLLAAAAAAAAFSAPRLAEVEWTGRELAPRADVDAGRLLDRVSLGAGSEPAQWLPLVAQVVVAVVLLVVLVAVVRTLARRAVRLRLRPLAGGRRGAGIVTGSAEEPEQLLAVVDAGLAELSDRDQDARRAVIGCWLKLERVAAAVGTARQPSDTATDLVVRLLRSHQVSESALTGLAETYQHARYAGHAVDEEMRQQACAALHRLHQELAGAVLR